MGAWGREHSAEGENVWHAERADVYGQVLL